MRIVAAVTGAAITIVAVLIVVVSALVRPLSYLVDQVDQSAQSLPTIGLILFPSVPPIFLAVVFVVVRRHWGLVAFIIGALATFGFIVLLGIPDMVVELTSGGFGDDEDCELDICLTAGEEFGIFLFFLLVSAGLAAVVGGFICVLASLARERPKDSSRIMNDAPLKPAPPSRRITAEATMAELVLAHHPEVILWDVYAALAKRLSGKYDVLIRTTQHHESVVVRKAPWMAIGVSMVHGQSQTTLRFEYEEGYLWIMFLLGVLVIPLLALIPVARSRSRQELEDEVKLASRSYWSELTG